MLKKPLVTLLATAGLLLFSGWAAAAPVSWLPLAAAHSESVVDPVFGGQIMVYEAGPEAAATVVLVHGISSGGARDWRSLMIDLAKDYHVVALDLPGFGASSKGNHLYAPEQLAVAVHKALAGRTAAPFTLLGYSLGAAVSLAYANLYTDELQRLILMDMPGALQRTVYTRFLSRRGTSWLDSLVPQASTLASDLVAALLHNMGANGFDPGLVLYSPQARQQWLAGNPSVIAAFAVAEHDFSSALRDVRVPTAVLWAEQDDVAPLRTGQVVAGVLPGAHLQVLPGAGHLWPLQQPELLRAAVRARLSGRLDGLPAYAHMPRKPNANDDKLSCNDRSGVHLSGQIRSLRLVNCNNTVIENANVGHIEIIGGSAGIINSNVFGGIEATHAKLTLTAGSVRGDVPLLLDATDVDAAGTRFVSEYDVASNRGVTPVTLYMSVATHEDPDGRKRSLHEVAQLPANKVWP